VLCGILFSATITQSAQRTKEQNTVLNEMYVWSILHHKDPLPAAHHTVAFNQQEADLFKVLFKKEPLINDQTKSSALICEIQPVQELLTILSNKLSTSVLLQFPDGDKTVSVFVECLFKTTRQRSGPYSRSFNGPIIPALSATIYSQATPYTQGPYKDLYTFELTSFPSMVKNFFETLAKDDYATRTPIINLQLGGTSVSGEILHYIHVAQLPTADQKISFNEEEADELETTFKKKKTRSTVLALELKPPQELLSILENRRSTRIQLIFPDPEKSCVLDCIFDKYARKLNITIYTTESKYGTSEELKATIKMLKSLAKPEGRSLTHWLIGILMIIGITQHIISHKYSLRNAIKDLIPPEIRNLLQSRLFF